MPSSSSSFTGKLGNLLLPSSNNKKPPPPPPPPTETTLPHREVTNRVAFAFREDDNFDHLVEILRVHPRTSPPNSDHSRNVSQASEASHTPAGTKETGATTIGVVKNELDETSFLCDKNVTEPTNDDGAGHDEDGGEIKKNVNNVTARVEDKLESTHRREKEDSKVEDRMALIAKEIKEIGGAKDLKSANVKTSVFNHTESVKDEDAQVGDKLASIANEIQKMGGAKRLRHVTKASSSDDDSVKNVSTPTSDEEKVSLNECEDLRGTVNAQHYSKGSTCDLGSERTASKTPDLMEAGLKLIQDAPFAKDIKRSNYISFHHPDEVNNELQNSAIASKSRSTMDERKGGEERIPAMLEEIKMVGGIEGLRSRTTQNRKVRRPSRIKKRTSTKDPEISSPRDGRNMDSATGTSKSLVNPFSTNTADVVGVNSIKELVERFLTQTTNNQVSKDCSKDPLIQDAISRVLCVLDESKKRIRERFENEEHLKEKLNRRRKVIDAGNLQESDVAGHETDWEMMATSGHSTRAGNLSGRGCGHGISCFSGLFNGIWKTIKRNFEPRRESPGSSPTRRGQPEAQTGIENPASKQFTAPSQITNRSPSPLPNLRLRQTCVSQASPR